MDSSNVFNLSFTIGTKSNVFNLRFTIGSTETQSKISNVSKIIYFKKEEYREQTDINIFLYNFIGAGFNAYYKQ